MLVTVKRNADGTLDGVAMYPETQEELLALQHLVEDRVNLSRAAIFLNKEPKLKGKTKLLPSYESPDSHSEVYRHTS